MFMKNIFPKKIIHCEEMFTCRVKPTIVFLDSSTLLVNTLDPNSDLLVKISLKRDRIVSWENPNDFKLLSKVKLILKLHTSREFNLGQILKIDKVVIPKYTDSIIKSPNLIFFLFLFMVLLLAVVALTEKCDRSKLKNKRKGYSKVINGLIKNDKNRKILNSDWKARKLKLKKKYLEMIRKSIEGKNRSDKKNQELSKDTIQDFSIEESIGLVDESWNL